MSKFRIKWLSYGSIDIFIRVDRNYKTIEYLIHIWLLKYIKKQWSRPFIYPDVLSKI